MEIKSQTGQTMVEYMLLLAVALSLVITFYNSAAFKRLFGNQGSLGKTIKDESEFAYRHAYMRNKTEDVSRENRNGSVHPSYTNPSGGSRFFSAKDPYP